MGPIEVGEFSLLTAKSLATQGAYLDANQIFDASKPKAVALGLMTKSTNTLMAGFELVLTGYMWEPPMLFRNVLEGSAVGWDLVHNTSRFKEWNAGRKFDSTLSISNLKKAIEPVGKMYGLLSNMNVHTSHLNSSPSMVVEAGAPKFQMFGNVPPGQENIRKGEIYFALVTAYIALQLVELVFHEYSTDLETVARVPGTDLVRTVVSERHRPFVDEAVAYFQRMSDGGHG
jgi:hypothetical protein